MRAGLTSWSSDHSDHPHEHQSTSQGSFRIDKHWPEKVSNNWDVVCILPDRELGGSDYKRFLASTRRISSGSVMMVASRRASATCIRDSLKGQHRPSSLKRWMR